LKGRDEEEGEVQKRRAKEESGLKGRVKLKRGGLRKRVG
jgi:hypothetical protein